MESHSFVAVCLPLRVPARWRRVAPRQRRSVWWCAGTGDATERLRPAAEHSALGTPRLRVAAAELLGTGMAVACGPGLESQHTETGNSGNGFPKTLQEKETKRLSGAPLLPLPRFASRRSLSPSYAPVVCTGCLRAAQPLLPQPVFRAGRCRRSSSPVVCWLVPSCCCPRCCCRCRCRWCRAGAGAGGALSVLLVAGVAGCRRCRCRRCRYRRRRCR